MLIEKDELLLVKWVDNNCKRYDGKINKEYVANIVREKHGKLKAREKLKYTVRGNTSLEC